jgi:hypothetical protein
MEPHHLKGERFSAVVEGVTEGNGQIDLPHRHRTFSGTMLWNGVPLDQS